MSNAQSKVRYTKDHEWARLEGEVVRVGITEYAVSQLGDVTLVDLPQAGKTLQSHEHFGDIESVKTVSELFSPLAGTVVEVNSELADKPELVNEGPYEQGWMITVKPLNTSEFDELLDEESYKAYVKTLDV